MKKRHRLKTQTETNRRDKNKETIIKGRIEETRKTKHERKTNVNIKKKGRNKQTKTNGEKGRNKHNETKIKEKRK